MYRIARREQFSENSFLWEIEAPDVAQAAQPGHFVMRCLREGGERIPLTVADFDRDGHWHRRVAGARQDHVRDARPL